MPYTFEWLKNVKYMAAAKPATVNMTATTLATTVAYRR
jgi:hypothetical protein